MLATDLNVADLTITRFPAGCEEMFIVAAVQRIKLFICRLLCLVKAPKPAVARRLVRLLPVTLSAGGAHWGAPPVPQLLAERQGGAHDPDDEQRDKPGSHCALPVQLTS